MPVTTGTGDVGYSPPVDAPNDDGVVFPITDPNELIIDKRWITGLPPNAPPFIPNATMPITTKSINGRTGAWTETTILWPVPNGFAIVPITQNLVNQRTGTQFTQVTLFSFPVTQFWLELKNLNRPFSNQYNISVTDLQIPMMINLEASATP